MEFLTLIAVAAGCATLWKLLLQKRAAHARPPIPYEPDAGVPRSEPWRWPLPPPELALTVHQEPHASWVRLTPRWRLTSYLAAFMAFGLFALAAWMLLTLISRHLMGTDPQWTIGLFGGGLFLLLGQVLLQVEPQVTAIVRTPAALEIHELCGILVPRKRIVPSGAGWSATGDLQNLLTTTIDQDSLFWVVTLRRPGKRIIRLFLSVGPDPGRWLTAGIEEHLARPS